jgi:hypothetical protein
LAAEATGTEIGGGGGDSGGSSFLGWGALTGRLCIEDSATLRTSPAELVRRFFLNTRISSSSVFGSEYILYRQVQYRLCYYTLPILLLSALSSSEGLYCKI